MLTELHHVNTLDAFDLGEQYLRVSTEDLHEAQAAISRIYQPYRWDTAGTTTRGAAAPVLLHHAPLGDISLSTLAYGRSIEIQPEVEDDAMLVVAALEGCVDIISGGQSSRCTTGRFAVISSPRTTTFMYGEACRVLKVGLNKRRAEALCWRLLGGSRKTGLEFEVNMTDSVLLQRWSAFSQMLLQVARTGFDHQRDALMAASLEEMLLGSLLHGQANTHSDELATTSSRNVLSRQLRRAISFIEAHADEPITASRIAEESGCSFRSLTRGFADSLNTTPMRYLRELRLRRVRAELLKPERQKETIIAVASSWGFGHMGEFASHYRILFGESPNETRSTVMRTSSQLA